MLRIEFFEPPMCCSTGLCGPSVDEKLVKINEDLKFLRSKYKKNDIEIERYQISKYPSKFRENTEVYQLLQNNSKKVLPITAFNGKVIKTHGYPALEELETILGEYLNGK